jgi:hypothetical protein
MKVLDLRCVHGHRFEGWFASGEVFETQLAQGLVECPVCGDRSIAKLPAAPRLNLSGATAPPAGRATGAVQEAEASEPRRPGPEPEAQWLRAMREMLARTENVGDRFADEARKMHYGEVEERAIRGQATRSQAEALIEEGIGVLALPLPPVLKETLQ